MAPVLAFAALLACSPARKTESLPFDGSLGPGTGGVTIRVVRDNPDPSKPVVVTVNGFLSEGDGLDDWRGALAGRYADNAWLHVDWPAANIATVTAYLVTVVLVVSRIASNKDIKDFTKDDWADIAGLIDTNSWRVALKNAHATGHLLCRYLKGRRAAHPDERFILMGNSLGARVVYQSLACLADGGIEDAVAAAHLLGGAVGNDPGDWGHAKRAVSGVIWNYYSRRDEVLEYLYPIVTLFLSAPAGRNPISGVGGVENVDVTAFVPEHLGYKENARKFLR